MGIFVGLGRSLFEDLSKEAVHLVYGIPNKAAMPGHRKLSWEVVSEIPRYIIMLDRKKALSAYRGGWLRKTALRVTSAIHSRSSKVGDASQVVIERPPSTWPKVRRLWETVKEEFGFALERTENYLAWRYPTQSSRDYVIVAREHDGRFVAVTIGGIGANGLGQIAELFHERGFEKDAGIVLHEIVAHFRGRCHTVEALASTDGVSRVLRSAGFFKVSKVSLIAHANDGEGVNQLKTLLGVKQIMLSYGDSDLA